jgi:hypothetical protein
MSIKETVLWGESISLEDKITEKYSNVLGLVELYEYKQRLTSQVSHSPAPEQVAANVNVLFIPQSSKRTVSWEAGVGPSLSGEGALGGKVHHFEAKLKGFSEILSLFEFDL